MITEIMAIICTSLAYAVAIMFFNNLAKKSNR